MTAAMTRIADPFDSGMWPVHRKEILGDPAELAFDLEAVRVIAPTNAEDVLHTPVMIDARAAGPAARIVATADYSPIPKILTFRPGRARATLAFGFKLDQSTAVRASLERPDGGWRVGGAFVRGLGGGCTQPAAAHGLDDWQATLGQLRARLWPSGRLRLRATHPMDTGLADGIPAFHLTEITLSDADGAEIASLELHEPVEEDPAFAFDLPPEIAARGVSVRLRDNMGLDVQGFVPGAAS